MTAVNGQQAVEILMHGTIKVESELGKGSKFTVTMEHKIADMKYYEKKKSEPAGTYDLVLMDIQMPNMDGYMAAQTIRHLADEQKANIPIIAMTANAFEEDRQKAFSAGMNGHIAKLVDVEKLEQVLVSVLKKK